MKICPSCNNKCADSTKYCPRCNRYLGSIKSVTEEEYYKDIQLATFSNNSVTVTCPYCKSTNVRKIGSGERVLSIFGLGILSNKINKSFKCKSCGGTF